MNLILTMVLVGILMGAIGMCYYPSFGKNNHIFWSACLTLNSPAITLIPWETLRQPMERLVALVHGGDHPLSTYKRCLLSALSGVVLSLLCIFVSFVVQLHQLSGCPTFTATSGTLMTAEIDIFPVPWKLPCLLSQDTVFPPSYLAGDRDSLHQVRQHWDFNPITGHLISAMPNKSVDVELRLVCAYGLVQWSCGVLHQPTGIALRADAYPPPKQHPLYPEVENPAVFILGIVILFGISALVCMFCFVPILCVVVACCCGSLLMLPKRVKDEL